MDQRKKSKGHALWARSTQNPDKSTGLLARLFACSLAPLTRSLAPDCSLCSRPPLRSLVRSLAHFAHSLVCGKVNYWMAIYSVFFSILAYSALLVNLLLWCFLIFSHLYPTRLGWTRLSLLNCCSNYDPTTDSIWSNLLNYLIWISMVLTCVYGVLCDLWPIQWCHFGKREFEERRE